MAPLLDLRSVASGAADTAESLRDTWANPSQVVSVLMIVAGDIVGAALDNLSGPTITPVVFSFGWVGYAHKAFTNAIAFQALLSPPQLDEPDYVVDCGTGRMRVNRSWLLQKALKDADYWKPNEVKEEEAKQAEICSKKVLLGDDSEKGEQDLSEISLPDHPLTIAIYTASRLHPPGTTRHDLLWYSGLVIAIVQLGIASIPCALSGRWSILMITGAGTVLAFATGTLPQFGAEKWKAPNNTKKSVAIVRGALEEATSIVVVRGEGVGLDLEDLARGESYKSVVINRRGQIQTQMAWPWTRIATGFLAACWIVLLLTMSGLRYDNWYLLAVAGVGLVQNAWVAANPRDPGARGLHLDYQSLVSAESALRALLQLKETHGDIAKGLLKAYAPRLPEDQGQVLWEALRDEHDKSRDVTGGR
ncbi:hypothetical protein MBLNU230_g5103t1 [Neophaeotheca triangularis]